MKAGVAFSSQQSSQESSLALVPGGIPEEEVLEAETTCGTTAACLRGPHSAASLSHAPPSASAPPFPQPGTTVLPSGPGSTPPTTLLVLLQHPQLPQRAPSLSCWVGLPLWAPSPLPQPVPPKTPALPSSRRALGATAPVTSAQSGRGWGWLGPGAAAPAPPEDLLQTEPPQPSLSTHQTPRRSCCL